MTDKDVARTPAREVGTPLAGTGLEALSPEDFQLPRIKLLQALSPEVVSDKLGQPGEFFHTVMQQSMGKELQIVVLMVAKSHILWNPRGMGGGILARSLDGIHWEPPSGEFRVIPDKSSREVVWRLKPTVRESRLDQFGTSDPTNPQSQPAADTMMNFLVTFPGQEFLGPAIVTCRRTSLKNGQNFAGQLQMAVNAARVQNRPAYTCTGLYTMASKEDKNKVGQVYYNYRFRFDGLVPEVDLQRYISTYELLSRRGLREEDIAGETETEAPSQEDLPF